MRRSYHFRGTGLAMISPTKKRSGGHQGGYNKKYMIMNLFNTLPEPEKLLDKWNRDHQVEEVNGHLHSPFSFCSFDNIGQMFRMAGQEGVKLLGINDFFTVDGYDEFARLSLENRIFPLFNIEFTGLIRELQQKDVRVNDPNNPGRTYFSGKGLKYPLRISASSRDFLDALQESSQDQVREMVLRVDAHLSSIQAPFNLDYGRIRDLYAENLVRERHIARAISEAINSHYPDVGLRRDFFTRLFDGKALTARPDDPAAVENEIRSVILKKGGKAFVPEDIDAFPELGKIMEFILDAGGVPCYPVLLDDRDGNMTGFERDWDLMDQQFQSMNVNCLELIPARNSLDKLKEFVEYFQKKHYIIMFGTEHNAPGLAPITVRVEKDRQLPPGLKEVSYRGCCALAAHQYQVARGGMGLVNSNGVTDIRKLKFYEDLGNAVIKEFTS
jgi:hypothetical protein